MWLAYRELPFKLSPQQFGIAPGATEPYAVMIEETLAPRNATVTFVAVADGSTSLRPHRWRGRVPDLRDCDNSIPLQVFLSVFRYRVDVI